MKISIITATFNSEVLIGALIKSLELQTNHDFEWIVADGGSKDRTVELVNAAAVKNKLILQRDDFGIYDAINGAIKVAKGEYYLVVGSDDHLEYDCVNNFITNPMFGEAEIITANLMFGSVKRGVKGGRSALNKQFAYVSSHAVGTIFKTKLHDVFGLYTSKFPIAADQLFILTACKGGAKVEKADFVAGTFAIGGVSSYDFVGTLSESFRIQLKFHNRLFQVLIFIWKLLRYYRDIK